jgi:hypothetical protein
MGCTQASLAEEFKNNTFSSLLRPKQHVIDNERKRRDTIEQHNELMRSMLGEVLPEQIEQELEEEVPIPKTPIEKLTEDCAMMRHAVDQMSENLLTSVRAVKYAPHNAPQHKASVY